MAQAVCDCAATIEARVQHQACLCGNYGEHSGMATVSPVSVVPPFIYAVITSTT
jgi:hypothetical protein